MSRRRLVHLVVALAATAASASAQPLTPALCPAGSSFNPNPTLTPFPPGGAGIPLLRHTLDPALHPAAKCNDGSQAVMYIRPAHAAYGGNPINEPSNKWLVFLDGGGGCHDADECLLTRWCGGGGRVFDRAGKMSAANAPPAIAENGIFELQPPAPVVNHFRDYNHVLLYYCSSDNWIGSSQHAGLASSTGIGFDIRFEGEAIVDAAFATLIAGPTAADPQAAALFYPTALPSLQGAREIVLAGESAGGGGLRHHLDKLVTDVLQPAVADPEVRIRAIVDAGAAPGLWGPAISWADPYSPGDYAHYLEIDKEPTVRSFWGADDSALDASCLDPVWQPQHDLDGSHPQVCYDTTYTLMHHITTPVFLRQDITDPSAYERYVDWALFATSDDYWSTLYAQLGDFAAAAGALEPPSAARGTQGIVCQRHVAIRTNDGFFRHRVVGPAVPASFHDLVVNWLTGAAGPTVQIQVDGLGAGAYSPSFCP